MISLFLVLRRFIKSLASASRDKEFRGLLALAIIILLTGTIFYNSVEHWGWLNALYFSVTTLTTIGLGDFTPHSNLSKIFTIVYIFVGLGIILGFINIIAKHATKNYMSRAEEQLARSENALRAIADKILPHQKK